jgi:hypothetical protein
MYIGRHAQSTIDCGQALPQEWTESFVKVLTETYFAQSEKDNRFFDVYALSFEKEFVVIISYIHHNDHLASPISVFISHDQQSDSTKMKKILENLVNLGGHIFDDIFSVEQWSDFNPNWTENDFNGNKFFYKVTRENIGLSLQAEEILKKGENI